MVLRQGGVGRGADGAEVGGCVVVTLGRVGAGVVHWSDGGLTTGYNISII